MTSSCATVVFLWSPTVTRGVEPASNCRARAPAVTTNSNELGNLLRSIMESPGNAFCGAGHAVESRPLGEHHVLKPLNCGIDLVVDDDEIVLGERGHFLFGDHEPPLDLSFAVFTAPAQPLLQHDR